MLGRPRGALPAAPSKPRARRHTRLHPRPVSSSIRVLTAGPWTISTTRALRKRIHLPGQLTHPVLVEHVTVDDLMALVRVRRPDGGQEEGRT